MSGDGGVLGYSVGVWGQLGCVGLLSGCVVTLTCSVVVHIVSALQAVVCGELEFAWD